MPLLSKVIKSEVVRQSDNYVLSPRFSFFRSMDEPVQFCLDSREPLESARLEADRLKKAAQQTLREAEQQARQLLDQAQAESVQLKEQAREEGYSRGYSEALEAARVEAEEIKARARQVLNEARECRRETLEALEGEVVSLAREIAEKLVARQLSVAPETVLQTAKDALQLLYDREQVTIFAHPSEAEIFKARQEELLKLLPDRASLQVVADPALKAGGCRVETERGLVDASLDNRWEALLKALYSEG